MIKKLGLSVVEIAGNGGITLAVPLSELPSETRAALAVPEVAQQKLHATPAEGPSPEAQWRYSVIERALRHPSGSSERIVEVRRLATVRRHMPTGRYGTVSERTILEWIKAYEAHGIAGLRRKRRTDKGSARVVISTAWDQAVPFDDATRALIADKLRRDIRSLWAANLTAGWRWIARLAGDTLMRETRAAGFDPDARKMKRICTLPRHVVERDREFRAVAIQAKDRKRHFDGQPRIQRTREGNRPMQMVVGDVHHLDILFTRPDGSVHTPKVIAWLDWATNRPFLYPVFLPKGQMVRQEHVIEAYMAMVQHPEWGLPGSLYLDNGGEYNWAGFIDDAQQLTHELRYLDDGDPMTAAVRARRSSIIKAQPYNAPAKSIEGTFAALELGVLSMLPGWIGGNRMKKKTANVGRAPEPYPGTAAEFRRALTNAVAAYETHPQHGVLGGKSPREVFAAHVAAGWQRTDVDADTLAAVFARPVERTVDRGTISVGGIRFTHRVIQSLPHRHRVIVRVPLVGDRNRIPVVDLHGQLLCVAIPDRAFNALDKTGAREAATRQRVHDAAVADMRRQTEPVDMEERLARLAEAEPPAPIPESGGIVRLSEHLDQIGRELATPQAAREAVELDDYERRVAERLEAFRSRPKKREVHG